MPFAAVAVGSTAPIYGPKKNLYNRLMRPRRKRLQAPDLILQRDVLRFQRRIPAGQLIHRLLKRPDRPCQNRHHTLQICQRRSSAGSEPAGVIDCVNHAPINLGRPPGTEICPGYHWSTKGCAYLLRFTYMKGHHTSVKGSCLRAPIAITIAQP